MRQAAAARTMEQGTKARELTRDIGILERSDAAALDLARPILFPDIDDRNARVFGRVNKIRQPSKSHFFTQDDRPIGRLDPTRGAAAAKNEQRRRDDQKHAV